MANPIKPSTDTNWSPLRIIIFRYCFIFFALHNFPFPISDIPVIGEWISEQYENIWDKLINWGGKFFFGIPEITIKPLGSGDTTWNWVQEFLILLFSVIGCFIWSLFDRKKKELSRTQLLEQCMDTLLLRFYLACLWYLQDISFTIWENYK